MYYDKRFQMDTHFPFVAFSHAQIKAAGLGGWLIADIKNVQEMSDRLLNVDLKTVSSLAIRFQKGENVKPQTENEKACFQIIKDLDHVNAHVQGSTTSKKFMRNEIWSLIAAKGAPSWYITLSPTDVKSPIAFYYADTNEKFTIPKLHYNDKLRTISKNPVASARFFHFMVTLFLKHILGVNSSHDGVYGKTSAYYGTVEQ
ncbi:hypothetical protein BDN72DRAFT_730871, partial [Pluteus cervinus]